MYVSLTQRQKDKTILLKQREEQKKEAFRKKKTDSTGKREWAKRTHTHGHELNQVDF